MNFEIKTVKSKSDILKIINDNTNDVDIEEFKLVMDENGGNKYFNGKVYGDSFIICKETKNRREFTPIIVGTIEENIDYNIIKLNKKYKKIDKIFWAIWFIFVIILSFIFRGIDFENAPIYVNYIPYYMIVMGIILFILPYNFEFYMAKRKIEKLLL